MAQYPAYAHSLLLGAFCLLLLAAAVSDGARYIIPNTVVVGLAALFFVAAALSPLETAWLSHVGAAATVFAGGLLAYRFGAMGAGDVKLMAAAALWTGFAQLPPLLAVTALAGGALALGLVAVRLALHGVPVLTAGTATVLPRAFRRGAPVPYGIAIASASLFVAMRDPHLLALA